MKLIIYVIFLSEMILILCIILCIHDMPETHYVNLWLAVSIVLPPLWGGKDYVMCVMHIRNYHVSVTLGYLLLYHLICLFIICYF